VKQALGLIGAPRRFHAYPDCRWELTEKTAPVRIWMEPFFGSLPPVAPWSFLAHDDRRSSRRKSNATHAQMEREKVPCFSSLPRHKRVAAGNSRVICYTE
jgi:hypothetical protein